MARIRSIKPETASDRKLAGVSRDARYTFLLIVSQCDDDGLMRAEPRQLLGQLYPYDADVTPAVLEGWVWELVGIGAVRFRQTVDGMRVIQVVNWEKHQHIKNRSKPFLLTQLTEERRKPRRPSSGDPTEALRSTAGDPGGAESRVLSLESKVEGESIPDDGTKAVIDHYRTVHPKRLRGKIPPKVLRLLRVALESYPADDLCRAIDGNAASQFHRDNGHMGLDLVLRDATKIDYFLDLARKAQAEVKVMTDDNGVDRPHRRNASGEWEAVPA